MECMAGEPPESRRRRARGSAGSGLAARGSSRTSTAKGFVSAQGTVPLYSYGSGLLKASYGFVTVVQGP